MTDFFWLIVIMAGWIVLNNIVLPKLGVPT
jgi:hypothetical protein